jgi:phage terminase large subunit GpA-like protein
VIYIQALLAKRKGKRMKSKYVWAGLVSGGAATATGVYMARKKIAAFAVQMASKAAVKAPITIANQTAQATVGKAKDTAKDAGRKVSGVSKKLPGKLKVGK